MCKSTVYVIGKVLVNRRLLVVKFGGELKVILGFLTAQGVTAPNPILFKDQLYRCSAGGDPQTITDNSTQNWLNCINTPISIEPYEKATGFTHYFHFQYTKPYGSGSPQSQRVPAPMSVTVTTHQGTEKTKIFSCDTLGKG